MTSIPEALDVRRTRIPVDTHYSDVVDTPTGRKLYTEYNPHSNYIDDSGDLRRAQQDLTIEQENGNTIAIARNARYLTRFSDLPWPVAWKPRDGETTFFARPAFVTAFDEKTVAAVRAGQISAADSDAWILNTDTRELENAFGISDVVVQFRLTHGGPGVRHRLYESLRQLVTAEYYATVWEVSDPEAAAMLTAGNADSGVKYWTDGRWVIEYVRRRAWDTEGEPLPYIEHDYTTVGGTLTADTVWTAGTYYVTSTVNLSTYTLTLDAEDGAIYIKVKSGSTLDAIRQNDTGNLTTANTGFGRRVIFTSENDDIRGEIISGSSGTPAKQDWRRPLINSTTFANITDLAYVETHYGTFLGNGGFFDFRQDSAKVVSLNYIWIFNCQAAAGAARATIFHTLSSDISVANSFSGSNIYVDSSNDSGANIYGIVGWGPRSVVSSSLVNAYFAYDNSAASSLDAVGYFVGSVNLSGASTHIATNVVFTADIDVVSTYRVTGYGTGTYVTFNRCVSLCAVDVYHFAVFNATAIVTCSDSVVYGNGTDSGLLNVGGSVVLNSFATGNVAIRIFGGVDEDNNKILGDPLFGNLPSGATIADTFIIPDGFAIGNLLEYRYQGSDSYENLGLDATTTSATGYRDLRVDEITPGIQYDLRYPLLPTGGPEDEGDVLIFQTNNDGEITIENGLVTMTPGLDNVAYLSLFGGNEEDPGGDDRTLEWWGNTIATNPDREYRSETQHLLRAIPATTGNLRRIQDAARRDLAWMVPAGIASTIDVVVTMPALNKVEIIVTINGDETLTFLETWQATL